MAKSANIIATIHSIADEAKGPSYSVRQLYREIYSFDKNIELVDCDYKPEVNLLPFSVSLHPGTGPARLGRSPEMWRYLNAKAKEGGISLIHNHGLWMMPNVYPGKIARKYNLPLVTSPRGTFATAAWNSGSIVKKIFWPLLQKPALEPTICFHATAESEYLDIRKMGYRQPVAVIPNGIELPFGFTKKPQSLRTLLYLGRVHPIKGLDMLLFAWQKLQKSFPEWQLKIVGPDYNGHLAKLQNQASELNLTRISFNGPLYQDAKWQEYHNADLFVLPSHSENFAMSVAEALASRVPVVVTKGAPWQCIEELNIGCWTDISTDAIYQGLAKLMALSGSELASMGQRGRDLMEQDFSWPEIAKKMFDLYQWVLTGGTTPEFVICD